MYVCICHSVTEKDIQMAAKKGANTLHDIKELTGCATGCGTCADVAIEVLQNHQVAETPDFLKILQPSSDWSEAVSV